MQLPPHAYVPGQTPRHPEDAFEALRATARPGMTVAALGRSRAWEAGLIFLREGYFWEAHEVMEPVWLALPAEAPERAFVQAAIQAANAELKRRMGRPRAVLRICEIALSHLAEAGAMPGLSASQLRARLSRLRDWANPDGSDSV